jgi:predicted membrane chloride channel (bestrophin family)
MHVGKGYRLSEFLLWTRREIHMLILLGTVAVCLYELARWRWLTVPWTAVALIGTATAFIVSFRNTQTCGRTVEAQQVWTAILGASTENPFEAGANDVPIAHVNRLVEIELGEILGDAGLPPMLQAKNDILL